MKRQTVYSYLANAIGVALFILACWLGVQLVQTVWS